MQLPSYKIFLLTLAAITLFTIKASAQDTTTHPLPIFVPALAQSAQFPGGSKELSYYLVKAIHYPEAARKNKVQGKVLVKFVVEKDGSLVEFEVAQGIGSGCDEEAVRALQDGPKWNPAKYDGRPVRQPVTIPISFTLP